MKLLMLKGLPASGKSSFSKELVAKGWVRTNKDDLRKLLHGGKWSKTNEKQVLSVRDTIVISSLSMGKNVVVDDTNFHPSHEEKLRSIADAANSIGKKVEFEIKHFDTDVEECIKRDLKRGEAAVGEQVIRKMWREYVEPVKESPKYLFGKTVIVDIDGTLAIMKDRGPFEWDKVGNDELNTPVRDIVTSLDACGFRIVIFSGRDASCRKITEEWLNRKGIPYDSLHMRPEGDNRKDVVIKKELYESLKDDYNFTHVIDDRPQVCRMWHTEGLCLLKVGDPDLQF